MKSNIKTNLRRTGCVWVWAGFMSFRIGTIGGFCECGNESSVSINGGNF